MFRIKGQVQTSHLSKLQANRRKSYFRDKFIPILSFYRIQNQILSRQSHSNTSILPNTNSNRLTYHVSHRGTNSNIPFIKLVGIQTIISFSRQGSIQYFHFTEYKTKLDHIYFGNKRRQGTSSNFPFIKLRDKGHFNTFILPNLKPNRFQI